MAIMIVTYDAEMYGPDFASMRHYLGKRAADISIPLRWMERAIEVHTRRAAPCTAFVVGKVLEQHPADVARLDSGFREPRS